MSKNVQTAVTAGMQAGKTASKKIVSVSNKARGRTPTKFELEIIPYFVGELPPGIDRACFVWERGTKVQSTEAEPVNPHTRAVFWKQYLKQVATIYKHNDAYNPKEYYFKVQHVKKSSKGKDERKTIAKTKVDLARFCTTDPDPAPQEVFLQLKPQGKLKISIKASWLQNAAIDPDALTEASFTRSDWARSSGGEDEDEQDLSGFDNGPTASGQEEFQDVELSPKRQGGGGGGGGRGGRGGRDGGRGGTAGGSAGAGGAAARKPAIPGEIPGFTIPLDPEEKRRLAREEKERAAREAQERYDAMVAEVTEKIGQQLAQQELTLVDRLCCCMPRRQRPMTQEDIEMMAAQQVQSRRDNDDMVYHKDKPKTAGPARPPDDDLTSYRKEKARRPPQDYDDDDY